MQSNFQILCHLSQLQPILINLVTIFNHFPPIFDFRTEPSRAEQSPNEKKIRLRLITIKRLAVSSIYIVVGRVIKRWETSVTCCRLNHNLLLFVVQLIYFSFVMKKHGLGPKNCTCQFSLQEVFNFFFLPDSQGPKLKREREGNHKPFDYQMELQEGYESFKRAM